MQLAGKALTGREHPMRVPLPSPIRRWVDRNTWLNEEMKRKNFLLHYVLIAVGAIFGAIYKVAPPFDLVWVWGAIWAGLGLLVTVAVKGREPARRALADLSTGEEH